MINKNGNINKAVYMKSIMNHFTSFEIDEEIKEYLTPIKSEDDFQKRIKLLDELLDMTGGDETHKLSIFINLMSSPIEEWEDKYYKIPGSDQIEVIKFLLEENKFTRADLIREVFLSKATCSSFLNGKRELSKDHIKRLKQKYSLSADLFI